MTTESSLSTLIDEMGRPQHAEAFRAHELAHMSENIGARLDVEPDGRFVEQQQTRPMQQRARNFDAADLAAREIARLVIGAIGEARARQRLLWPRCFRLGAADSVQGRVIKKILHDAQFEIERARLKHDAEAAQGFTGFARDIMAEDLDRCPRAPRISRVMSENSVLLPAPLRPSRTVKLPRST